MKGAANNLAMFQQIQCPAFAQRPQPPTCWSTKFMGSSSPSLQQQQLLLCKGSCA